MEFRMPMPKRIAALPRNPAGYPIPWFVDQRANPANPDFRIMDGHKLVMAVKHRRCWVCGTKITGPTEAFLIGPMCAVNRTSAEPPSHQDCAEWSALTCPFLSNPKKERREAGMPEDGHVPGVMIKRNPGVTLMWIVRHGAWSIYRADKGILFDIGEPLRCRWFAEGREATRQEVMHSIETGLPLLARMAVSEGIEAMDELERRTAKALRLVPA